jgi:hypothetical protein
MLDIVAGIAVSASLPYEEVMKDRLRHAASRKGVGLAAKRPRK